MKLVDRHTQEKIRSLSEDEKRSLVELYTKKDIASSLQASDVISLSREKHYYFRCDCVGDQPASPTLTTRQVGQGYFALANLPGRVNHSFDCPFSYHSAEESGQQERNQHTLENLVFMEDGRLQVDNDQLGVLYRTLTTNTQLNRLTVDKPVEPKKFRERLIDGARLSPTMAKQGISKKVRFGLDQYAGAIKELRSAEENEWLILISLIDGTDGHNVFKGSINKNPYKIPAGAIVRLPAITFGPMVATTVIASKGSHAFALATAIDSVYQADQPIVVNYQEDRLLLAELVGKRPLMGWVDRKEPSTTSFVELHSLPTLAPITKTKTHPRMTIGKGGVRVLVADPVKMTREAYDEQGIVLWHRSFSHIPAKVEAEFAQFKSKLAGVLLNNTRAEKKSA